MRLVFKWVPAPILQTLKVDREAYLGSVRYLVQVFSTPSLHQGCVFGTASGSRKGRYKSPNSKAGEGVRSL